MGGEHIGVRRDTVGAEGAADIRHIPREQCTVGALRAQAKDVDTTPKSYGTGAFKKDGGIVTAMTLAERIAARSGR